MIEQLVTEGQICQPTLERACKLIPEFTEGFRWFQEHEGEIIPQLPHRMKEKPELPSGLKLSRDSGIHSPSRAMVKYRPHRRFVLSVHASNRGQYSDGKPFEIGNGTWIYEYAAHENDRGVAKGQEYNQWLNNNLSYGIPVGVMVRESAGYRVLGLAYVDSFNYATGMFCLHGPVNAETEARHLFDKDGIASMDSDIKILTTDFKIESNDQGEEELVFSQQVCRRGQAKFREILLDAYAGKCSVTQTDVVSVLDAAHINPYRAERSYRASNGLLLRADLHRLYDAHLISIKPESHEVVLAEKLEGTYYDRHVGGSKIVLPSEKDLWPSEESLDVHYRQFQFERGLLAS